VNTSESRSVQLVARNREYPKGLNNVPCVVRSCNKLHATWNYVRDVSFVHQDARHNMEKNTPLRKCKTM